MLSVICLSCNFENCNCGILVMSNAFMFAKFSDLSFASSDFNMYHFVISSSFGNAL